MARSGAKVALLDKEHFPRDKICGDAVCTPAIHILEVRALPPHTHGVPLPHPAPTHAKHPAGSSWQDAVVRLAIPILRGWPCGLRRQGWQSNRLRRSHHVVFTACRGRSGGCAGHGSD